MRADLIELIETVIIYKLSRLSREEVQAMLQVHDIRETRVYQEAKEEGVQEERKRNLQQKLEAISKLAACNMSAERIADIWAWMRPWSASISPGMPRNVPKFYRDCFEQGVLGQDRQTLLRRIFFESSSPLRTQAENWFLKELRGQYDVVLRFVARHPGCLHNELMGETQHVGGESSQQVGAYLKVLSERYQLIEKRLPVFAAQKARRSRYYLTGR